MLVRRLWLAPLAISLQAYCTFGVVSVLTAPEWDWYSAVSSPRSLNVRCIWLTMLPPVAAS